MDLSKHWDMAERLLGEAEQALSTPPRDAATGFHRVQGALGEVRLLRQQLEGARVEP